MRLQCSKYTNKQFAMYILVLVQDFYELSLIATQGF
jgi:hypothetical protein